MAGRCVSRNGEGKSERFRRFRQFRNRFPEPVPQIGSRRYMGT